MADNGRWFKLWCSAACDPDLANLDIADFGRWAKFGAYIKEHGTDGSVTLKEPSKIVTAMLQLPTLNDVILCLQKIKNVTVSPVTDTPVSFLIKYENWFKYQGDFSTNRVQKFRAKKRKNETPKKRGEEKRREEIRKEEKKNIFIKPLLEEIKTYCLERKNNVDPQKFIDHYDANGWRVGKNKMVNWKAAVRTWEKNIEARNPLNAAGQELKYLD